jgi:4-oxalocrotonate tautomerase
VSFTPPGQWFIAGRSLEDLGLASFWLDVKVTDGTNPPGEKAAFLADTYAFLRDALGPLHEESYILVHQVRADAYGYGGLSQGQRAANAAAAATAASADVIAHQAGQPV